MPVLLNRNSRTSCFVKPSRAGDRDFRDPAAFIRRELAHEPLLADRFRGARLIAPPQDLTATSHLIFWHKFITEDGFDGGVLEISKDGGSTWVDVLAGGGSFIAGGYNGNIDTGFDSPIAGRAAWTGNSDSVPNMNRVEVNLGAFAGTGVRVRWRASVAPAHRAPEVLKKGCHVSPPFVLSKGSVPPNRPLIVTTSVTIHRQQQPVCARAP